MLRLHIVVLVLSLVLSGRAQKENNAFNNLFYDDNYDSAMDYDNAFNFGDNFTDEIRIALSDQSISTRRMVMSLIYIIIIVVGLVLNMTSIFTSQKCNDLQYSQRLFMQNLALASIIMLLNLIFSTQYRILDEWRLGRVMCKLTNCLKSFSIFAQAYFATVLCMDYVLLRKRPGIPNTQRTVGEIVTVTLGWLLALGLSSPMIVFSGMDNAIKEKPMCMVFNFGGQTSEPLNESSLYEEYLDSYNDEEVPKFVFSECKEVEGDSYKTWIVAGFIFTYAVPLVVCLTCLLLYKVLRSPHKVLLRKNEIVTNKRQGSATKSVTSTMAKRFIAAGLWVTFIPLTYLITWLPFYVYHLGRIPGFNLNTMECMNFQDYCFVQGYLSCVLLPALAIAYSRPRDARDTHSGKRSSRGLTASSTSSFASAASFNSNRKSTSIASQSGGAGVMIEEEVGGKSEEKLETCALVTSKENEINPCTSIL